VRKTAKHNNTGQHFGQRPFLLMLWQLPLCYCIITTLPGKKEARCLMPYG